MKKIRIIILLAAFSISWVRPPEPSNLTLANFEWVLFDYEGGRLALKNSLQIGLLTATVGTIIGLLAAGRSREEILKAYPYLEPEDIDQALAYAAWRVEEREVPLAVA